MSFSRHLYEQAGTRLSRRTAQPSKKPFFKYANGHYCEQFFENEYFFRKIFFFGESLIVPKKRKKKEI